MHHREADADDNAVKWLEDVATNLPTLKYRRLRGDMIDVFKIANNMYDASYKSVPVLPFDKSHITRGNCFKLSMQSAFLSAFPLLACR